MKDRLSKYFFLAIALISVLNMGVCNARPIKVLYTAAIISRDYEERKANYIRNLQLLKDYGCDVYVVESCQSGPTFLDEFCDHVCYTHSNNPIGLNSYNEAASMKIGLEHFNFDPEEMIIKITGRYVLETDEFINLVRSNLDAAVIARKWDDIILNNGQEQHDAYTGCFAAKKKYLEEIINDYYFKRAVGAAFNVYAIEWALGDYIVDNEDKMKIVYLPRLYEYLPEVCSRK